MNAIRTAANRKYPPGVTGFSLVELLVVIAIVSILASIILPALSKAKAKAQATFCLNNTRQLVLAWVMYADEHNGSLPYNLGIGGSGTMGNGVSGNAATLGPDMSTNWVNNVLDWTLSPDNTNSAKLIATGIGPYVNRNASVYHCPSDNVLSSAQQQAGWSGRVRSYSMNGMIGDAGSFTQSGTNVNNPGYVQFFKMSSIPRPSDIFVFLDEHPDSITDGYFINKASYPEWQRLPASYHDGAASFVFADAHLEEHRWRNSLTLIPARTGAAQPMPIEISQGNDGTDFYWVASRMSILQSPATPTGSY